MVCADRVLVDSACLDPAYRVSCSCAGALPPQFTAEPGGVRLKESASDEKMGIKMKKKKSRGGAEMIECRICQEEGAESDMEAPCACNGTLKFAHRKCIQRWCNKKGDITCEICNQIYAPNYSSPPSRINSDVMVIDIRQSWASGVDLHDSHYLSISAADRELLHVDYEDYASANSSSISCCRSFAFILMLLLLIRHGLLIARDFGGVQETFFFDVSLLQFLLFLLPCYMVVCSCYNMLSRRGRQV